MPRRLLTRVVAPVFFLLAIVMMFNMYSPLMVKASSDITIHGHLTVHHLGDTPNGVVYPVQNARIDIYDEEIIQYPITGWGHLPWPDTYLGTVYTDVNGYYSFTVSNDDGSTILGDEHGRDIYLMVRATNSHAVIRNEPEYLFGSIYEYKMGTYADLSDGESRTIDLRPGSPEYQVAFEILSNIDKAWRYVKAETGIEVAKVNVYYEDFFAGDNSYYMPDKIGDYLGVVPTPTLPAGYFPQELIDFLATLSQLGPIDNGIIRDISGIHYTNILTDRFYETLYHEYGHHVMNEIFELGPPFSESGVHYLDTPYTPTHAWVEGWAEFYSSAAREGIGRSDYTHLGGTADIEDLGYDYSEETDWYSVEGNIAGILWDMHDEENEYFDALSLSFGEIVAFIRSYDPAPEADQVWPLWADYPWNIIHIFDAYKQYYNYDQLTSKVWNILLHSGITIPDEEAPHNPTSYTSSHNSVIPLNEQVIKVDVQGAYDTISGVKEYYYKWFPYVPTGLDDPDLFDNIELYWEVQTSPHFEFDTLFDRDEWYLYIVTCDYAGNFAEDVFEAGPFKIHELYTLQIEGIITTSIGEIYGNSFTEVSVPTLEYPSKTYQSSKFHLFTPDLTMDPIEFTGSFDLSGKDDGKYQMEILGVEGEVSEQLHILEINIDNTDPIVWISVGDPNYVDGVTYVTSDTIYTIGAEDSGSGVKSIEYSLNNVDWITYNGPFTLPVYEDGSYTLYAKAFDNLDHVGIDTQVVVLDNTSPEAWVVVGEPKIVSESIMVAGTTLLSIESDDLGCGVDTAKYKVYSEEEPEVWTPYSGAFSLPPVDGEYTFAYQVVDNLGNAVEDTLIVINDNAGPELEILSPLDGAALQDGVLFRIEAVDPSGVEYVKITIRSADDPETPIGFEELLAEYDSSEWVLEFNTLQLLDGDYVVIVSSSDGLGNTESISSEYSVRNWAVVEMLPSTPNSKAGRTMPIKFTIRVDPKVDPQTPFVYNEDLTIRITGTDVSQVSTFGDSSIDYRIDAEGQQYITNFKTSKTKQEYTVEIYRSDFLVSFFTFSTTK